MNLPVFKYHPAPLSTGSLGQRTVPCICCGEAREYIYTGPVYSRFELDEVICPWCIESGLAHEKYDATFTDDYYGMQPHINMGTGFFRSKKHKGNSKAARDMKKYIDSFVMKSKE